MVGHTHEDVDQVFKTLFRFFLSSAHSHALGFAIGPIDLNTLNHEKKETITQKSTFLKMDSGVCRLSKTQRDYHITLMKHLRTIMRE